jgi:hypothetical protein
LEDTVVDICVRMEGLYAGFEPALNPPADGKEKVGCKKFINGNLIAEAFLVFADKQE